MINDVQNRFLTYINTLMVFGMRLKDNEQIFKPVHISTKEIEQRFFVFPKHERKAEIKKLIKAGELEVIEKTVNGHVLFYYQSLRHREIDLNLINVPNTSKYDNVTIFMRDSLKLVSLPPIKDESLLYFNLFLKYKSTRLIDLFFKVDEFAGRIHTPVSSLKREYRPFLLIESEPTVSIDVTSMQPLVLGRILKDKIGVNDYSNWIESGKDIYLMLKDITGLQTRDEAKKRFFEITFAPPSNELAKLFGDAHWINWINEYKQQIIPANPHNSIKKHSNLAWLLQRTEVMIMRKIWHLLAINGLKFFSVHDEIIIKKTDYNRAVNIFKQVLSNEFVYFKLNIKEIPQTAPVVSNHVFNYWHGFECCLPDFKNNPIVYHNEFTQLFGQCDIEKFKNETLKLINLKK